jgi:hypothetical protein
MTVLINYTQVKLNMITLSYNMLQTFVTLEGLFHLHLYSSRYKWGMYWVKTWLCDKDKQDSGEWTEWFINYTFWLQYGIVFLVTRDYWKINSGPFDNVRWNKMLFLSSELKWHRFSSGFPLCYAIGKFLGKTHAIRRSDEKSIIILVHNLILIGF